MSPYLKVALTLFVGYVAYLLVDPFFDPDVFKGKNVVITGASTGIGEELAYHYARYGARILITARRESRLQKVVAKCVELGAEEAHYISLDMSYVNSSQALIREAEKKLKGVDTLLLNHIAENNLYFWDGNLDWLQKMLRINYVAYVGLATQALPLLEKSGGSIIVMSSASGMIGIPYVASYSGSKFALNGFFQALRQELVINGSSVAVTMAFLGRIETENYRRLASDRIKVALLMSSPEETALAIVKAGAKRAREMYYPWYEVRPIILLHEVFPGLADWIIRKAI